MRTQAPVEAASSAASSGPNGTERRRGGFRQRILPRTVIGTVAMLLAASIGFAFGGTILYAYYQYRLDGVEDRVSTFVNGFEDAREEAVAAVERETEEGRQAIQDELEPLRELRASGATLRNLISQVSESIYLVETQDDFGQPRVGSAFVVTADAEKSYLVTSLSVVKSSTKRPGPAILLRKGDEEIPATLHTWHEERDLALLIVDRGSLPRLKWAPPDEQPEYGERVFVVAGVGGAGGSITQGFVADVSAAGIQHDAAVAGPFAGGPLLNSKGEAVAVGTPEYAPLGFTSDRVTFAPLIRTTCERVLKCPDNAAAAGGAGERR